MFPGGAIGPDETGCGGMLWVLGEERGRADSEGGRRLGVAFSEVVWGYSAANDPGGRSIVAVCIRGRAGAAAGAS